MVFVGGLEDFIGVVLYYFLTFFVITCYWKKLFQADSVSMKHLIPHLHASFKVPKKEKKNFLLTIYVEVVTHRMPIFLMHQVRVVFEFALILSMVNFLCYVPVGNVDLPSLRLAQIFLSD